MTAREIVGAKRSEQKPLPWRALISCQQKPQLNKDIAPYIYNIMWLFSKYVDNLIKLCQNCYDLGSSLIINVFQQPRTQSKQYADHIFPYATPASVEFSTKI